MSHAPTSPDDVMRALRAFRYHAGTEPELHAAITTALTRAEILFSREVRLDDDSRIDFLVSEGIGIEVKMNGSLAALTRQVARYAAHPTISTVIVVTTRHALSRFPPTLSGKPIHVVMPPGAL